MRRSSAAASTTIGPPQRPPGWRRGPPTARRTTVDAMGDPEFADIEAAAARIAAHVRRTPLLGSAEGYVQMWEAIDARP